MTSYEVIYQYDYRVILLKTARIYVTVIHKNSNKNLVILLHEKIIEILK